jgi:hypothetical protein
VRYLSALENYLWSNLKSIKAFKKSKAENGGDGFSTSHGQFGMLISPGAEQDP